MQDYHHIAKIASRIELPPRSVKVGADVWDIVVPSAGLGLTALILSRLLGQNPKTSALLTVLGALAGAGLGASGAVSIKDLLGGGAEEEPAAGKGPAAAGKPSVGVGKAEEVLLDISQIAENLTKAKSEGGSGWSTAGLLVGGAGGGGAGQFLGHRYIGPVFGKEDAGRLGRTIEVLDKAIKQTSSLLDDTTSDLSLDSQVRLDVAKRRLEQAKAHLTAAREWAEKPELSIGKGSGTLKAIENLWDAQEELGSARVALSRVTSENKATEGILERLRGRVNTIDRTLRLARKPVHQRAIGRGAITGSGAAAGAVTGAALLSRLFGPRKE